MAEEVETIQDQVAQWADRNRLGVRSELQALNIAEEAGELCRAVLKRAQGIRGTEQEWTEQIYKEAGDLVLSLYRLAAIEGWYLSDAVNDRWAVVKTRNWVSDPVGHGIGESDG